MTHPPKQETEKPAEQTGGSQDRFWVPRFWSGITIAGYFSLLARNRFAIAPRRMAMAAILSSLTFFNFVLWVLQAIFYGRRIRRTEIEQAPIFIIGHWRSGTTLLHELLVLDERHTYPDTYASFCPNHFLVSGWLLRPCLRFLLPSRRPMDNMAAGWDRPQEDEFALCNMGVRSPYLTMMFPNRPPQDQEYLDLEGVPPEGLARWKGALLWFLKSMTVRSPQRIVLKSPPHTCRIKVLLELFPEARFIHIVRDPQVIFPSTLNLWRRLYRDQGLQVPKYQGLEEHVFRTFQRMYEVFQRDQHLISPSQFCEVRYEDLVQDPVAQTRRIYQQLDLGKFDDFLPKLKDYLAGHAEYQTNRYSNSPEVRAEIDRRWGPLMKQYGYCGGQALPCGAGAQHPGHGE
jgi:hypothetical protein